MQVAARDVRLGPRGVDIERRIDGAMIVRSRTALAAYPAKLTDRLEHWAVRRRTGVLFAQRRADGAWRTVTYREALAAARSIGQALLDLGLSPSSGRSRSFPEMTSNMRFWRWRRCMLAFLMRLSRLLTLWCRPILASLVTSWNCSTRA